MNLGDYEELERQVICLDERIKIINEVGRASLDSELALLHCKLLLAQLKPR